MHNSKLWNILRTVVAAVSLGAASYALGAVPGEVVMWGETTDRHREVLRAHAAAFWEAWDAHHAGEPVEFDFVWPEDVQPGDGFDPFFLSVETLSAVYADRLVVEGEVYTYDIYDLIEDDPEVFEAFRHHSLTGELVTPIASQQQAALRHFLLQVLSPHQYSEIDGDTEDPCTDVYYVESSGLVVTTTMVSSTIDVYSQPNPCPGAGGTYTPEVPELEAFKQALRDAIDDSGLTTLYDSGFRIKDGRLFWPGFDCDDYADAIAWWLEKEFGWYGSNFEVMQLWMRWPGTGHVVTVVRIGQHYFVIDVQTGTMRGPYSSMEDAVQAAWSIIDEFYLPNAPRSRVVHREPGERPFIEPNPWYEDPDVVDRFRQSMPGRDPSDYAPPGWGQ